MGKQLKQWQTLFWEAPKSLQWWRSHEIKKRLLLGRKVKTNLDSILKSRDIVSFIETTDAEAETPILRLPDVKNWLIGKDPDTEKDWKQEEKGMTEDEMVGWHH